MRPHTSASCFAIYVVQQLLFVDTFEERRQIVWACCLAWNLALIRDPGERERQLARVLDAMATDMAGTVPGTREAFAADLRALADLKHDLFPWLSATIAAADLLPGTRTESLRIEAEGGVHTVELASNPQVEGMPLITKILAQMHRDTREQRRILYEARATPDLLREVATMPMVTAYCAQRSCPSWWCSWRGSAFSRA